MGRTLNDFLSQAGVKVAAAAPAAVATSETKAAAAVAAPAKTASAAGAAPAKVAGKDIAPSQPSKGEANDGHKARVKNTEKEPQDTGATGGDSAAASTPGKSAAVTKTAAQKALSDRGIDIADAKIAEITYGALVNQLEQEKAAELNKYASEMRAQGALLYQGMIHESTAWKLATGEAKFAEAQLVANVLNVSVDELTKRAEQIGGAMTSPALVGGMLGSAARTDSSETMRAGERNGSTTETRGVEAIAGTRGPVSGADEKLKRFTDVWTMPGNPGLNHGQVVDQGKKLGE